MQQKYAANLQENTHAEVWFPYRGGCFCGFSISDTHQQPYHTDHLKEFWEYYQHKNIFDRKMIVRHLQKYYW